MVYYIFSFSYLEKKKIKDLKNSFLFDQLSDNLNLNFLTKKNFDSFFSDKYLEIKNLLSGKYFIFSFKKKNCDFKEMLRIFELVQKFITNFDSDISLFTIIFNNIYIFNDFLVKSNSYNIKNILDLTNINKKIFMLLLIKKETSSYSLNFARINNLNIEKRKIYLSYYF